MSAQVEDDEEFCPVCFVGMESASHYDCEGAPEGCPDCGKDSVSLLDIDDEATAYCIDPHCGWGL